VAFSLTITALTAGNKPDKSYRGTVTITSTDPAVPVLVVNYNFTAADKGKHTFKGLILRTGGIWAITVQDLQATPLTGSRNVKVV
jgi:hypothetical protein